MTKPKRHHFVPRAYLARFGRDDRVAVRWRDRSRIVVAATQNIAVESGFYETVASDGSRSVVLEEHLADVDGEADQAIAAVIKDLKAPAPGSAVRETLAFYMAVQKARTPEARAMTAFPDEVLAYAGSRQVDEELMTEYLERVHLGISPDRGEVRGALSFFHIRTELLPQMERNEVVSLPLESVGLVTELLLSRHWCLEFARKARLITSDTPLTLWSRPTFEDRFRGLGLKDAEEIRFPLSPGHQLLLTKEPRTAVERIEPKHVARYNADHAAACHRFIVGHPDRQRVLAQNPLATKRPAIRFSEGPGFQEGPDGELVPMKGEILHTWVQRYAPAPAKARRHTR